MKTPDLTNDDPLRSAPASMRRPGRSSIRILLSEGSRLSARQTITALGRCGYTLDVCDPNPLCISRFSRFVRRYYRYPAVGTDPLGWASRVVLPNPAGAETRVSASSTPCWSRRVK